MATANCTFSNWKWYKSGGTAWTGGSPTNTNIYAGGSYVGCLTFKTPTFTGSCQSISLSLNVLAVNGSGITESTLYATFGTTAPTSLLNPYDGDAIGKIGWYTTITVSGLNAQDNQQTFTLTNAVLKSNTTYYLWLYGGKATMPYQHSSYNYIKINYTTTTSSYAPTLSYSPSTNTGLYSTSQTVTSSCSVAGYHYGSQTATGTYWPKSGTSQISANTSVTLSFDSNSSWTANQQRFAAVTTSYAKSISSPTVYSSVWLPLYCCGCYNYSNLDPTSMIYLTSLDTTNSATIGKLMQPPNREDYTFQGFSTSATSTSTSYTASTTFSADLNGATLYAVYKKPSSTQSVTLNANGGSISSTAAKKTTAVAWSYGKGTTSGGGISYTNGSLQPTRTGYTFQGWATSSSGSVAYSSAQAALDAGYTGTLYAVWKINTYTFTYMPGSYAASGQSSFTSTYNYSSSSVSLSTNYFTGGEKSNTKQTYTLTCNCSNGSFSNGSTTAQVDSDYDYYIITYNQTGWQVNNNSVNSSTSVSSYPVTANRTFYPYWGSTSSSYKWGTITLTTPSESPTRTGYTFQSWRATDNNTSYGVNTSITQTSSAGYTSKTLYAIWSANAHTLTYNPGLYCSGTASSQTIYYGNTVTLKSNTYYTGKTYNGSTQTYYTNYNCNNGSFSNGATTTSTSGTTYVQYQYVQNGWHTTNDMTGGTKYTTSFVAGDSDLTLYPYIASTTNNGYQQNITFTILAAPTRTGYSFKGWNTNSSGTGTTYQPGDTITYTASSANFANVQLYAIWSQNTYTINYLQGDATTRGTPTSQTANCNESTTLATGSGWKKNNTTANSTTYTTTYYLQGGVLNSWNYPSSYNSGTHDTYGTYYTCSSTAYDTISYTLNGWATSSGGSKVYNLGGTYSQTGTSSKNLYPAWSSTSVHTYAQRQVPKVSRVGYVLKGWSTSSSGDIVYAADAAIENADNSKTLYAIWEPEWTVKIHNGTSWNNYHVWIYTGATTNSGWQQAIPYIYNGSTWKLTSI